MMLYLRRINFMSYHAIEIEKQVDKKKYGPIAEQTMYCVLLSNTSRLLFKKYGVMMWILNHSSQGLLKFDSESLTRGSLEHPITAHNSLEGNDSFLTQKRSIIASTYRSFVLI